MVRRELALVLTGSLIALSTGISQSADEKRKDVDDGKVNFTPVEARSVAGLSVHEEQYKFFIQWMTIAELVDLPKPTGNKLLFIEAFAKVLVDNSVKPKSSDADIDNVVRGFKNVVLNGIHEDITLFVDGRHPVGKPSKENIGYFKKLDQRILKGIK